MKKLGIVSMVRDVQLSLGRGPSKVGPMSQPRGYHRSLVTPAGSYLPKALTVANWAAKGELYPHVGGNRITQGP